MIYALEKVKDKLKIPVVWNSGGYERVKTLMRLDGLVDIYLPDIKYMDRELSAKYSHAPDYFETAAAALSEMVRQCGKRVMCDGLMKRGVIVRHLILPGASGDSVRIIKWLKENYTKEEISVSLMSQYTPMPGVPKEISRRITTFEAERVKKALEETEFEGYTQERCSAEAAYIPPFDT